MSFFNFLTMKDSLCRCTFFARESPAYPLEQELGFNLLLENFPWKTFIHQNCFRLYQIQSHEVWWIRTSSSPCFHLWRLHWIPFTY